jgi:enhancing lycopene biosynthesis protein 2
MTGVTIDSINRIVTTPAFMSGMIDNYEIFMGIDGLIESAIKLSQ